jgi:glycerol kinase
MQVTADLAGAELRVATMSDCSPLGAALAGLLGLGIFKSLDEIAAAPRNDLLYHPSMPTAQSSAYYTGWQNAVRQVLPKS